MISPSDMTKDEFVKNACRMGYCTKQIAERYARGKEELTDDDYIEVFRISEEIYGRGNDGLRKYGNGKSTKSYRPYTDHEG